MNFSRALTWLKKSEEPRRTEAQSTGGLSVRQTLPRRLIRVNPDSAMRVVDTARLMSTDVRYTGLSYVWGKNQNFQLLKDNKVRLMAGLEYSELPKTIQDAVTVTRRLGYSYLWVDALYDKENYRYTYANGNRSCIIQDSDDDKARELPNMHSVYKNSVVTIVAAIAQAATEGFLHVQQSQDYLIRPFDISFYNEKGERGRSLSLSYPSLYKRWKDPLNDRAWTFQELLLPRRVILYSYRGVEFIDRTDVPISPYLQGGEDPQSQRIPWSGATFTLDVIRDDVRRVWLDIRGEYTRRKLSYAGDKLVAIAALAEELSGIYGTYLAGLWDQDLFMDLQWRRPDPEYDSSTPSREFPGWQTRRLPRPAQYRAPSWSWASIDGEVTDAFEDEEDSIAGRLDFRIISCSTEPAIEDYDFGGIRSASLDVEGRLQTFIWRPSNDVTADRCDGFLAMKVENEMYPEMQFGDAMVDALEPELISGVNVECLAMCVVERIPQRPAAEGLMLFPVGENTYRRVGFFNTRSQVVFYDVEPRRIVIV
jgi:hypothetical protein